MRISIVWTFFIIFIFQSLAFGAPPQVLITSPDSPITTSSGVFGSEQCTKNSVETYAVCAAFSNSAIKYNLQPFSFAAKGSNQGDFMRSCDLFETASQSTSRAVCTKNGNPIGVVYFHNIADMINISNVTTGEAGNYPHVIVDTPNQIAYVSNDNYFPAIYKITNIGSSNPIVAENLTIFGSSDHYSSALLIIDGFLYVHFNVAPASHLCRINISTFTWNQTVDFTNPEFGAATDSYGFHDHLANDNNYIYDLTLGGIIVRCMYTKNNFARFDSLNTGFGTTTSLAISPDKRTLFVVSQGNSILQLVDVSSFSKFGNTATITSAFGRPIISNWCTVHAFSGTVDLVYAFRLNSSACRSPSESLSESPTGSISTDRSTTRSSSISVSSRASLTATITSSISKSQTSSNSSGNSTSSRSRDTNSISGDISNTKSLDVTASPPNISLSTSSSASRMKSSSFSLSPSASAIFYPPPYVSPLREVYEAMATTSSLLSIGSMSAANVMGAARARSSLGQFSDILAGTCSLDADSFSDAENSPPDISDSPTRLNLGRNYLTGQTIGNAIVIIGVGALWMLGNAVKRWRSNSNINVNKKENNQKNKKHMKKNKKQTTDKKTFVEALAESNAHEMMLFFFTLLLEPTLSSSAMSLIGEIFVEGRTITVLSVVCVILSWFVLLVVGMGFALWKLIYVRNFDDDEFELLEDNEENKDDQKGKSWFRRFVEYTTSPFGEWKYKGHRKKEKILFELARPFIEPFTDSWPKFIVIDLGVIVLLSLTTIIPAMIPNESGACTIRGVALCLVLGLHVLLVVFYRLYTDRLSNTLGCVVDILSIAAVAGAMSIDENDVDQIEHFSRVALVQSIGQMTMSVLQVIEVMLPVWDGGIEFVAKLWVKLNKKQVEAHDHAGNGNSQVPPAIPLLQEMNLMPPRNEREKKSVKEKNKKGNLTIPLKKVHLSKALLPKEYYYDDSY